MQAQVPYWEEGDHRFPSSRCSSFDNTNVSPSLYAGRCSEHCVRDGLCREGATEERNKLSSERCKVAEWGLESRQRGPE